MYILCFCGSYANVSLGAMWWVKCVKHVKVCDVCFSGLPMAMWVLGVLLE